MAFQVSPGINVSEIDLTNIIPAVATTTGAFAGVFRWGPTGTPTLVSSEKSLASTFGEPYANSTWSNQESFFSAANFLSYGNALYVTRVKGTAINAADTSSDISIGNREEFDGGSFASDTFFAKYPGSIGSSLSISVCASATAYNSTVNLVTAAEIGDSVGSNTAVANAVFVVGSNTVTFSFDDANADDTDTTTSGLTTVLSKFSNNDILKVGGNYYKITSIGSASAASNTAVATATVSIDTKYKGTSNNSVTSIERFWEFYNVVDRAPQNSKFAADNGSSVVDEVHVVVYDNNGDISGTKRTVLEVFEGLSRATGAKSENGTDINLSTAINNRSAWLYRGSVAVTDASEAAVGSVTASSSTLPTYYTLSNGDDGYSDTNVTVAAIAGAYDEYRNAEEIDISLIITGRSDDSGVIPNYLIDNIATVRKDCVVFVSPAKSDVVSGNVGIAPATAVTNVTGFRDQLNSTSYAVLDSGYKYQYDKYNDQYVWIPLNGDVAGTVARTDNDRDPWFSPAGFNRGGIKNVVKLAFTPNKAERDELYKKDVNPVVTFPSQGTVLYGDKTLQGFASAFDRINVRRLFIVLEKAISNASNALLFEFNDEITRAQFRNAVVPFLREVQGRRGITDFSVVCDETNNTAEVVDQNQFVGDIFIKPARSINFIQLNFVAVRSGVEFSEVVGAV